MYEEDDITVEEHKSIVEYHSSIQKIFEQGDMIEKVITKIRTDPSEAAALFSWDKYHQHIGSPRFFFYSAGAKIDTILKNINILRYFEMAYPTPPEIVRRFYSLEITEIKEGKSAPGEFNGFCKYYHSLWKIASMEGAEVKERMEEIISNTTISRSRFYIEDIKGKVEIICQGMDILKSFGIGFPSPPNAISRFFLPADEQEEK